MRSDIVIIGGGPAGLAAAVAAAKYDPTLDILILERDGELGGILNQCIHNGFGLHRFKEELSGPEADEYIRRQLLQVREEDVRMHASTIGVHRDDLEICLNGNSARAFGSQGQQRSCALALKLAECQLLEELTGERPIILLDDVLSELDTGRREWLLGGIGQNQVFLTCCDPAGLEGLEHGQFHIHNGCLVD